MKKKKRWVLLEHLVSSSNLIGDHFDLLLEHEHSCRAWRLNQILELDGPPLQVSLSQTHDLSWLETEGKDVSGDRGWARPLFKGIYVGSLPSIEIEPVQVSLVTETFSGLLEISENVCKFSSV